jgi:MoaA/NifB/PqqE/SkfB family radical SAM enzyme
MYSSPDRSTFIDEQRFRAVLPTAGAFDMQLEGGEPTVHPDFWKFVHLSRAHPRCGRVIVCTNGTRMPRKAAELREWLTRLGSPYTLKLSVNHHLLEQDSGLIDLAALLSRELPHDGAPNTLVLNVRLRRGVENDDSRVRTAVESAGLLPWSNVFFLQRYGFARNESAWDEPFIVGTNFELVNPDGRAFGTDLVARSEAIGALP